MIIRLKREIKEFKVLIKSIPALTLTLFVLSVFCMNLLANKSINLPFDWLALDCGIAVSWYAFLTMDMMTRHFGAKASTEISFLAIIINLFFCFLLFIGSIIPGVWGESYVDGMEKAINTALDKTFGGTWYVIFGSALAFASSAVVNNFSHALLNKAFKNKAKGFTLFAITSYISTAIGQFIDNFIFAIVVSHNFFGWSLTQCITCALTGMLAELICEIAFSYFGYKTSQKWKEQNIGSEYFNLMGKGE